MSSLPSLETPLADWFEIAENIKGGITLRHKNWLLVKVQPGPHALCEFDINEVTGSFVALNLWASFHRG